MKKVREATQCGVEVDLSPAQGFFRGGDFFLQASAFEGMGLAFFAAELGLAGFLVFVAEAIGFVDGGALNQDAFLERNCSVHLVGPDSKMAGLAAFHDFVAAFLKGASIEHGGVGKHTALGIAMNRGSVDPIRRFKWPAGAVEPKAHPLQMGTLIPGLWGLELAETRILQFRER